MKRYTRLAFGAALFAAIIRLILGGVLMLAAHRSAELHLVVIADVPTVLTYFTLNRLGWHHDIADASDAVFLSLGIVTWFICVLLAGAVIARSAEDGHVK